MCGIGPFAIPLAMDNIRVHANDLNPMSYEYLLANAKLNKCKTDKLSMYNEDGRAFLIALAEKGISFDHAVMNLPQTATDFLDAFIGLSTRYPNDLKDTIRLPLIHVYAFSTADDPIDDIRRRCAISMRVDESILPMSTCSGHIVRDVAPKKLMICLSFTLPQQVAEASPLTLEEMSVEKDSDEPASKRSKTDE